MSRDRLRVESQMTAVHAMMMKPGAAIKTDSNQPSGTLGQLKSICLFSSTSIKYQNSFLLFSVIQMRINDSQGVI